jgi:hypothetical protein
MLMPVPIVTDKTCGSIAFVPENHKLDVEFVQANFRDMTLPMGLRVDSVKITGEGVHIETEPFQASVRVPGSLEVFVGERSLADYLNKKAPGGLRNFSVQAGNGRLVIQASMVMILELRATAVCTLRIKDGRQLWVDLESVQVMGAGATNLVQTQLDKINPVLDVEEFPIRASLEQVTVADGGVILLGTVAPP